MINNLCSWICATFSIHPAVPVIGGHRNNCPTLLDYAAAVSASSTQPKPLLCWVPQDCTSSNALFRKTIQNKGGILPGNNGTSVEAPSATADKRMLCTQLHPVFYSCLCQNKMGTRALFWVVEASEAAFRGRAT